MITRYIAHNSALHVQASQLLREAKEELSGENFSVEDLRKGTVLDNQILLVQAFKRLRRTATQPILFDGHCVVDNGERLLIIPVEVIDELAVTSIVFVEGAAQEIIQRRQDDASRARPARSVQEINEHQQRAKVVCQTYREKLGLPLTIILAGDEEAFALALKADFSV